MSRELDAHEYKLLLDPAMFSNGEHGATAKAFWRALKPLVDGTLGKRESGKSRAKGTFKQRAHRRTYYWDTADCLLTSADLALRLRSPFSEGGTGELTLKLRKENKEIVAGTEIPGAGPVKETTFEKDIGPLPVETHPVGASANKLRSRFARSTTVETEWNGHDHTTNGMRALFPTIGDIIGPVNSAFMEAPLVPGPEIEEIIFKGTEVDFVSGIEGEFTLTIWNFGDEGPRPRIAEISFRCKRPKSGMPKDAADQARDLFVAMIRLSDWVNKTHSSKTALALPPTCRNRSV